MTKAAGPLLRERVGAAAGGKERATARTMLPTALLCVVVAAFAATVHLLLFRNGSLNNDEVAYLLQAKAMAHGHLFLDVRRPAEATRIWFFVERSPGLVSKYLPLVSGLFAVGLRLTGSIVPVLAVFAGVLPLLVVALAREVGFGARRALIAAALVALSPITLMESALPLSYLPFLVLVTAAWLLCVRIGHGRAGPGATVLLGLVVSAAACARPYDTVLLIGPAMVWAASRRRRELVRLAGATVLGALPLGVAVALYDAAATGRALTPPFSLFESSDKIGFGVRRLFPEQSAHHFGPLQGLEGLGLHFAVGLLSWAALGLVLVPAAVVAWRRAPSAVRMLLVASVAELLGYVLFWGPWNFSFLWGKGTRVLGPIYALPLVVPLVLAGLPVLEQWLRVGSRRWLWLAVVAGVLSVAQLGSALVQASIDHGRTERILAAADRAKAEGPLLFDTDPPYLGHPVSELVDGMTLSATTPVPGPGAPAGQLLQLPRAVYGPATLAYALTREARAAGSTVTLDPQLVRRPKDVRSTDLLVTERGGRTTACPLAGARVVVTRQGVRGCEGWPVPDKWTRLDQQRCPDTSCLVLAVFRPRGSDDPGRLAWRRLPVETTSDGVALLVDAEPVATAGSGWLRVTEAS